MYETNLFHCGAMGYQVVVVPSCINLRKTTLQKLVNFSNAGGTVIFAGDAPEYVDCRKNNALKQLINKCERIRLTRQALLEKLDAWREIDLRENDGTRVKNLLYQLREEDDCRWLFIAQAYKGLESRQDSTWHRRALHDPQMLEIRIKGSWQVEKYDTLTGEICCLEAEYREGNTVINYELYGDDSLLLCLKMMQKTNLLCKEKKELTVRMEPAETKYNLPEPVNYRMSEPNVLVLDYFEYALDGEPYHKAEEILRLDNKIRKRLGFQLRCESLAQPYVRVRKETREHKVCLRTRFNSKIELTGCYLALEEAEHCTCTLNGKSVDMKAKGYYVDRAIAKVELPKIVKGENELCIRMDYGDCTNLERMYVLGEFGVELRGKNTFLYSKPDKLFWGDYTRQGFPFYTGNMTYIVNFLKENVVKNGGNKILQVPYSSCTAVKVSMNQGGEQMLAFLPYKCTLNNIQQRDNELLITCLGNRYNGFGQLHLIGDDLVWLGPDSWRTTGASWTDTYQIKPMGVLTAPQIIEMINEGCL